MDGNRFLAAAILASSFILHPSSFASDATFDAPDEWPEKQIPILEPTPPREDSLDRLKRLLPKRQPRAEKVERGDRLGYEALSPAGKFLHQLRDHNWQENVDLRIRNFTILGYRDATEGDRMLFRFLTKEEHAERRVMNSKASLLGRKPMDTRPPLKERSDGVVE